MELEDGVIGLLHGLPSSGVAITLLGSLPTGNHPASRSTNPGNKKTAIPVRVKTYSPNNETKKTEKQIAKINEECLKKLTNINIKQMKSVREKIKSFNPYIQKVCPKIRERLDKHQRQYHGSSRYSHHCEQYHNFKTLQDPIIWTNKNPEDITMKQSRQDSAIKYATRSVALSPIASKKNLSLPHTSQQSPHAINSVPTHDNSGRADKCNSISNNLINEVTIPLKINNTYEVLPKQCLYKENLQDEILKWIKNVSVSSGQTLSANVERDKLMKSLIEKIYNLRAEVNEPDYETKVKFEIESTLHFLQIYITSPMVESDQAKDKEILIENLLVGLRDLNDKYLVNGTEHNKTRQLYTDLVNLGESKPVSLVRSMSIVRQGVFTQYVNNSGNEESLSREADTEIHNLFQGINNFIESKSSDMANVAQSVKDILIQDALNNDKDNKTGHVNICYLPPNIRILKIRQGRFGIYGQVDENILTREMFKIEELTGDKHVQCDSRFNCDSKHSAPMIYSFVQKKGKTLGHKLSQCKCDGKGKQTNKSIVNTEKCECEQKRGKCDCNVKINPECECQNTYDKCVCKEKRVCTCDCSKDGQCACNDNKYVVETAANQRATVESQPQLADPKTSGPCIRSDAGTQRIALDRDPDHTLKQVVTSFMKHKDDVDDPVATRAFDQLLETEVSNLILTEGIYPNHSTSLPPERLYRELHYVKIISDWLKTIPIEHSFNSVGNKQRIEFINNLVKDISDVEERMTSYVNPQMVLVIYHHMKKLPILPQNTGDVPFMVNRLLNKLTSPPNYNHTFSSTNSSGLHEQNLVDFLEEYIGIHGSDIGNDELKLEAWITRLLQEIKKMAHNSSKPLKKGEVYRQLVNTPTLGNETLTRFILELSYVKEISEWLHNLPLLPISNKEDRNFRAQMVDNLADQMAGAERKEATNPNDNQAVTQLKDYIANWVSQLPIDRNREIAISVVVSQLINRMERVNKEKHKNDDSVTKTDKKRRQSLKGKKGSKTKLKREHDQSKSASLTRLSKSKAKSHTSFASAANDHSNPGRKLVEVVDQWSNKLDVKTSDPEEAQRIKDTIARKIYKKISELNVDPVIDDDIVYKEVLADEVDIQLQHLNASHDARNKKDKIKMELVEKIMDLNRSIKKRAAGDDYKQNLENTIDISMPNPIRVYEKTDPGFQIYKNCLAAIFILENYDHSDEPVKMKYEKAIKKEIDKFFESAQNRNAIPLSKEHIYNELYSALYNVPVPDETTIQEQVEEVKTKGELSIWFEDLPLVEAHDFEEDLKRDQILDTLAKRLHEMENNKDPDEKIHKEITKWLVKLEYLPGHEANIDQYAKNLQSRLKSSVEARRCPPIANYNLQEEMSEKRAHDKTLNDTLVSRVGHVEHHNARNNLQPPSRNMSKAHSAPYKHPVDIMEEVIEEWCQDLPLFAKTTQEIEPIRQLKEDLVTKIMTVVSELNANNTALYNNDIYEGLLDKELDRLLSDLPFCCEMRKTKEKKKQVLIEALSAIKSFFKREVLRQEYRNELNRIVDKILAGQSVKPEKNEFFNEIRDIIVDSFIEYEYNKDDIENQLLPKMEMHNAVLKLLADSNGAESENPLIKRNQLITALAKIKAPGDLALRDEALQVKMKKKVEELLNEIPFNENGEEQRENFSSRLNQTKEILAKHLKDIESAGHNPATHKQMKGEVTKCLRRIGLKVSGDMIDVFIEKLENDEAVRKTPPKSSELKQSQRRRLSSPPTNRTLRESEFRTRAPLSSSIERPNQTWPSPGGLEVPRQRDVQWISDVPHSPPRPAYPYRFSSSHPGTNSNTPFNYLRVEGAQRPYQSQFEQGHMSIGPSAMRNTQSPRTANGAHYLNQPFVDEIAPQLSSQGSRYGSRSGSPETIRQLSPSRQQENAITIRQNGSPLAGDPQVDEIYNEDECQFCNSRSFRERDYCDACKEMDRFPFMPYQCFFYF